MAKEPTVRTIKRLFASYGNQCAFPKCTTPLVARADTVLGEVCHIKGEHPGSARYDDTQSEDSRRDFANLIMLCPTHHKVIDDDNRTYTIERLHEMKQEHEDRHANGAEPDDAIVEQLLTKMVTAIHQAVVSVPTPLTAVEKAARYIELRSAMKAVQWYEARNLLIGLEGFRDTMELIPSIQEECEKLDHLADHAVQAHSDNDLVVFIKTVQALGNNAPTNLAKRAYQAWSQLPVGKPQMLYQNIREQNQGVTAISIPINSQLAAVGFDDSAIYLLDLTKGMNTGATSRVSHGEVTTLFATKEGNTVFIFSVYNQFNVIKWDYATGMNAAQFKMSETAILNGISVTSIAVTPDGEKVLIGFNNGRIFVWNVAKQQALCKIIGTDSPTDLVVLPDTQTVLAATDAGILQIWDLAACHRVARPYDKEGELGVIVEPILTLNGIKSRIIAIAVTAEGKYAVAATSKPTLTLWSLETGNVIHTFADYTIRVQSVVVTPDSQHAITGASDGTIRIWELATGTELRMLQPPRSSSVTALALTSDGTRLVSGHKDGTVYQWQFPAQLFAPTNTK